jgi:hypothetical protein
MVSAIAAAMALPRSQAARRAYLNDTLAALTSPTA